MDSRLKNVLAAVVVAAGVLVLVAFAYASVVYVKAYSRAIEPSSFRSFSVTGKGEVVAIPDVAQFTFSVITEGGGDIAELQNENVEKANNAIEFVKAHGVEDKDIKTQSFNIVPRNQRVSCPRGGGVCPPPEIVGYTITQTVQIKVRDFGAIGDIIAGVVDNGANSVSQLSFTIDDPEELQAQAREEAIQNAQKKAKEIAKAGDFRVGRLLSLQEGGGFVPSPYFAERAFGFDEAVSQAISVPTIEAGSQEVTIIVTLSYEIQ